MTTLQHRDFSAPEAARRISLTDDGAGAREVRRQIADFGFAIAGLRPDSDAHGRVALVARVLALGEPYVPRLYRMTGAAYGTPLVDIRPTSSANHPSFSTGKAQPYHTDGLLEDLGTIKTTLLYCARPALSGGRTVVLNSCAIFTRLHEVDPEAADVLLRPHILGKRSTLPGVDAETVGPAFAYSADGALLTRFGDRGPETWHPRDGEADALDRARRFFETEGREGSRHRLAVRLEPGDCLIFRNDLLSHGRESFTDDPGNPRHLVRGLYLAAP